MNNKKFIDSIALEMGVRNAEAKQMVESYVETLLSMICEGNSVSVQGFGTFEAKTKASRKMYNPTSKEFNIIPAKQTLAFKMSGTLKDKLNEEK